MCAPWPVTGMVVGLSLGHTDAFKECDGGGGERALAVFLDREVSSWSPQDWMLKWGCLGGAWRPFLLHVTPPSLSLCGLEYSIATTLTPLLFAVLTVCFSLFFTLSPIFRLLFLLLLGFLKSWWRRSVLGSHHQTIWSIPFFQVIAGLIPQVFDSFWQRCRSQVLVVPLTVFFVYWA